MKAYISLMILIGFVLMNGTAFSASLEERVASLEKEVAFIKEKMQPTEQRALAPRGITLYNVTEDCNKIKAHEGTLSEYETKIYKEIVCADQTFALVRLNSSFYLVLKQDLILLDE